MLRGHIVLYCPTTLARVRWRGQGHRLIAMTLLKQQGAAGVKVKHAILEVMNREALKAAVDLFDLDNVDRRSVKAMRSRLSRSRRAIPAILLANLRVADVRRVCELQGLSATGSKQALMERLLGHAGSGESHKPQAATTVAAAAPRRAKPPANSKAEANQPPRDTARSTTPGNANGVTTGYETELWAAANALRGNMDAAEYKHVVLGLIFLKYVSDAFEERHAQLEAELEEGADPEEPDEYTGANVFWVPPEARWHHLRALAKEPTIGQAVDDAMVAIERDNQSLDGVLPKDYARPALDKRRLGELIDLIGNVQVGDADARSRDVLGRVYEYFLARFASTEGKRGGEFYTARCVVKLLVEMLEPYEGRVYDPCCGSSGMFVQSIAFIHAHATSNGRKRSKLAAAHVSIYGQESNHTTWRLAKMNLAIRGIDGQIAEGDTFHNDRHPDLKADFILANPPFNVSNWGGDQLADDKRWAYGVPPKGNANFAWVQHMVHHLAPTGVAGFVLANGSMSTQASGEGEIRKNLVEANLVDCMIALPGQLFYSTQIPVCLWFLARDRANGKFRNRRGEVLFIDARNEGRMVDRTHRELSDEDIARIAETYHAWRAKGRKTPYQDVPGFCKSATLDDIRAHGHILTPGRYVGVAAQPEDDEPFQDKMARLAAEWREQQAEARRLDAAIAKNLAALGFGPASSEG